MTSRNINIKIRSSIIGVSMGTDRWTPYHDTVHLKRAIMVAICICLSGDKRNYFRWTIVSHMQCWGLLSQSDRRIMDSVGSICFSFWLRQATIQLSVLTQLLYGSQKSYWPHFSLCNTRYIISCCLNIFKINCTLKKLNQSLYRPGQALSVSRLWDSQISRQQHIKVVRLSALRTSRLYPPGNIPGTHFCYWLGTPQDHSQLYQHKSNYPIGSRFSDLPAFGQCLKQLHNCVPTK